MNSPEEVAFQVLKNTFIKAPILTHFNPNLETWLEMDVSDYIITIILS